MKKELDPSQKAKPRGHARSSGKFYILLGTFSFFLLPALLTISFITASSLPERFSFGIYSALVALIVMNFLVAAILALRKLDQSEGKFYQLMSQSGDGILLADLSGRYTDLNEAASLILGYSEAELIGMKITELVPHNDWARLESVRLDLIKHGTLHRGDWMLRHKKGYLVPVEICAKIISGTNRWQMTLRDITARKKSDEQLRFLSESGQALSEATAYSERLQKIAELLVPRIADYCLVFTKEKDTLQIRAAAHSNPEKTAMLVQLGSEFPPLATRDIGNPPDASNELTLCEDVPDDLMRSLSVNEEHYQKVKKLGTRSYLSAPLLAHGRVIGTISLGITEGSRRFLKSDQAFYSLVIHRFSMELDNARLYSEAVSALRSRDDILAIVSHDLKNPVAAIDLAAQVAALKLERESPTAEVRDIVSSIRTTNLRMKRLVDMLLNVGRLQAGTFQVNRRPMSFTGLFREVEEIFSGVAAKKSMRLQFRCLDDSSFDADFAALSQALSNLVANAIKFSPNASSIIVTGNISASGQVSISVQDQGKGISFDEQSKIFGRYWQPSASRNQGAGLGLFIVKGVIEAHGGHVCVESRLGEGSRFTIHFPATPEKSAEQCLVVSEESRAV